MARNAIRSVIEKSVMKVATFNKDRMAPPAKPNPYLSGVHAPVSSEVEELELAVTGTIPESLTGSYLRIGPNPISEQNHAAYHWFIGDGMVHGVRIEGGKPLWYRNRWIRSTQVSEALGEAPKPGPRNGTFETVNTNVIGHAGQIWALVEASANPVRIDAQLDTIAHDPFGGSLRGTFTAHPHLDPETGELHAICYSGQDHARIFHVVVDAGGTVVRREPIAVKDGPMIHDCMITKNYVIILDLPVTFSKTRLLKGFDFPYAWNPAHPARVGLLPRAGKGTDVRWYDVEPCAVFHPCNAYEDEHGDVILDLCVHDSMFAQSTMGPDSKRVPFERWTLPSAGRTVKRVVLDAEAQEFPRFNETMIGQRYRYAYTMALPDGFDAASPSGSKLFKHDLEGGTRQTHDFGAGAVPGEFVFIPAPDGKAEDHGWLMGFVINWGQGSTDLVILNAQDFAGEPQAVIHIPHHIPPGFHGNWIA